jgi:hypothetical protein
MKTDMMKTIKNTSQLSVDLVLAAAVFLLTLFLLMTT